MLPNPLFWSSACVTLSLFWLDLKVEMQNVELLVFGYQCTEPLCFNVTGAHEGKEG